MPRLTALDRRVASASSCASLSWAPARLICRPSTSPSQPSSSASAMRAIRLSRTSASRARWAGSGRRSECLTQACSWTQGDPKARAQVPMDTFRFSKWARKASHSSAVGVRYSSPGREARLHRTRRPATHQPHQQPSGSIRPAGLRIVGGGHCADHAVGQQLVVRVADNSLDLMPEQETELVGLRIDRTMAESAQARATR